MQNFLGKLLKPHNLTNTEIAKATLSGVVGAATLLLTCAIINSTLIEMSLNKFFAFYFGIVFIFLGSVIFFKISGNDSVNMRKPYLGIFALTMIISGIISFTLEEDILLRRGKAYKVITYGLLGIALTFSIVFALVDVLNWLCSYLQPLNSRTLIETQTQILFLFFLSSTMGAVYGLIFAFLEFESTRRNELESKLRQDQKLTFPLSLLLGFIAGMVNEVLRVKAELYEFTPVEDPFKDEI